MSPMLTSLVGSYPQPEWLVDRDKLRGRSPARVRAREIWRVDPAYLQEAQDAAVLMAVRDQERAGLDIVTDGEMRRESYSNFFVSALEGLDLDTPGSVPDRSGNPLAVPRVVGPIRRRGPVQVRDVEFLRSATARTIKVTVPGPFTMAAQAQNDFYDHPQEVAFAFADAVREEIADLFAAGADIVQLDEPWMESRADDARAYGIETLQRALDGVRGTTTLHICFGYPLFVPDHARRYRFLPELAAAPVDQISIESAQAKLDLSVLEELAGKTIILGVIALDDEAVETPEEVAARIERALPYTRDIVAAPDCGMKYLSRASAYGKLEALVAGAKRIRTAAPSVPGDRPRSG
jgi:5-methyltetrahydropteroyltriglutamate--homocysteine methyltransferase